MALTLAELNEKLIDQNTQQTEVLVDIKSNIGQLNTRMGSFAERFKSDRLREAEDKRESQQDQKTTNDGMRPAAGGESRRRLFDSLPEGGVFGMGAALARALPGFLLGRAVPAFLAKAFADEIADYIESATGSKTIGDAVYRGLNLGALGLLFGKKLGAIGFVAGALLDENNKKQLNLLGIELTTFGDNLAKMFGLDALPSFTEALQWVTKTFGNAIKFLSTGLSYLNTLMKDNPTEFDEAKMKQDAEVLKDTIGDFGLGIGMLALAISPGGTLALALGSVTAAFALVKNSIRDLGKLAGITVSGALGTQKRQMAKFNTADIASLTDDEKARLGKQGAFVKDGKLTDLFGKELSVEDTRSKLSGIGRQSPFDDMVNKSKYAKRFGMLKSIAKKLPFIGTLITSGTLASILMDNSLTEDEKINAIGGLFGGVVGGLTAGAAGGLLAGLPGAVVGGVVGAISGEWGGEQLAKWLLGGNAEDTTSAKGAASRNRDLANRNAQGKALDDTQVQINTLEALPTAQKSQAILQQLEALKKQRADILSGAIRYPDDITTAPKMGAIGNAITESASTPVADTGFRFFNQQDNSVSVSNPTEVYSGPTGTATDAIANRLLPYSPSF